MTLDKYIAIKWPHKAATHSAPGTARKITMALYISVCIYNIPHFFISNASHGQCFAYGISSIMTRVYSWFTFVLNAIIPYTLLIHMNYIIVKTVRNSHKMFRTDDTNIGLATRQITMKSAEKQVTIMLLLVYNVIFYFNFPYLLQIIYLLVAK